MKNFESRYEELVDCLSRNEKHEEINFRMDNWCDKNLDMFNSKDELERATIDYLESLCLEYGAA